jgi:hypothetical protein
MCFVLFRSLDQQGMDTHTLNILNREATVAYEAHKHASRRRATEF